MSTSSTTISRDGAIRRNGKPGTDVYFSRSSFGEHGGERGEKVRRHHQRNEPVIQTEGRSLCTP